MVRVPWIRRHWSRGRGTEELDCDVGFRVYDSAARALPRGTHRACRVRCHLQLTIRTWLPDPVAQW